MTPRMDSRAATECHRRMWDIMPGRGSLMEWYLLVQLCYRSAGLPHYAAIRRRSKVTSSHSLEVSPSCR